ncbi:MAG: hypothetical protein C4289_09255, partial [Chloroflexota bacterium]
AIIGGGIGGLAAARRLLLSGAAVTVLEGAPILGGLAGTFEVAGTRLERHYHHVFLSDKDFIQLTHELGLDRELLWLESRMGFYTPGRVYPFGTPLELLRFGALSPIDRLRCGLILWHLQKRTEWHSLEQVTAAEWLRPRAGKAVFRVVWEPLLKSKFGEDWDRVSMAWLWARIFVRAQSRRAARLHARQLPRPAGAAGPGGGAVGRARADRCSSAARAHRWPWPPGRPGDAARSARLPRRDRHTAVPGLRPAGRGCAGHSRPVRPDAAGLGVSGQHLHGAPAPGEPVAHLLAEHRRSQRPLYCTGRAHQPGPARVVRGQASLLPGQVSAYVPPALEPERRRASARVAAARAPHFSALLRRPDRAALGVPCTVRPAGGDGGLRGAHSRPAHPAGRAVPGEHDADLPRGSRHELQ